MGIFRQRALERRYRLNWGEPRSPSPVSALGTVVTVVVASITAAAILVIWA
jgi:hypothetical protein